MSRNSRRQNTVCIAPYPILDFRTTCTYMYFYPVHVWTVISCSASWFFLCLWVRIFCVYPHVDVESGLFLQWSRTSHSEILQRKPVMNIYLVSYSEVHFDSYMYMSFMRIHWTVDEARESKCNNAERTGIVPYFLACFAVQLYMLKWHTSFLNCTTFLWYSLFRSSNIKQRLVCVSLTG